MNLRLRNKILFLSYLFFIPSLIAFFYALFSALTLPADLQALHLPSLIIDGLFLLINGTASFFIFNHFKSTYSVEIFYFVLFLNFSSLYAVEALIPILFWNRVPAPFFILAVKAVRLSHFLSLSALFLVAFFKSGIETKNPESFVWVLMALSILFTGMQPVDLSQYETLLANTGRLPSPLLLTTAGQQGFFVFLSIIFTLLTVASGMSAYAQTAVPYFLFQSAALLLIGISVALICFQPPLAAQITGFVLYLIAIPFFAAATHRQYKWS